MRDLLRYPTVIYDANCIVYFCFKFPETNASGNVITVLGPETALARRVTESLVQAHKTISTIHKVWLESDRVLGEALEKLIRDSYIQNQLELRGTVSSALKLKFLKMIKREMDLLKNQQWFKIDQVFRPAKEKVEAVTRLYAELCLNPDYAKTFPPYKGNPSDTDINLILYSGESHLPLLTNDAELFKVAAELKSRGFCELIKGFRNIRFN